MTGCHGPEWPSSGLFSPISRLPLYPQGASLLTCANEIWPVVENIPFLRADRLDMARRAVDLIKADDIVGATALLLTDQDAYAPDPPPTMEACVSLVQHAATLSFREAMQHLAFGRVADYFAHRWSDPTYISGLALFNEAASYGTGQPVLELACGTGHFLRAFALAGIEAVGADLVFAKLWLTRRFICPQARLVCFDASTPWPLAEQSFATVFCHDAFYFLPDKNSILAQMYRVLGEAGTIAIGHAHNAAVDNHSKGDPLEVSGYLALLPNAQLFDDHELTAAFAEARSPRPAEAGALAHVPAVSLIWNRGGAMLSTEQAEKRSFGLETGSSSLHLNPLYRRDADTARIEWPSLRYEQEYAGLATYPMQWTGPDSIVADDSNETDDLIRRRIYIDLPRQW